MTKSESPTYAPSGVPVRNAPAPFEPVTVDEAKKRCDVPDMVTLHDAEFVDLIAEARAHVEADMARIAAAGSFNWELPEFPDGPIILPYHNVTRIEAIKYLEPNGSPAGETLDDFQFVEHGVWPTIWPAVDEVWPVTVHDNRRAVKITFDAGDATAAAVSPRLKQAVLCRVRIVFAREDFTSETWKTYESIVNADRTKYP